MIRTPFWLVLFLGGVGHEVDIYFIFENDGTIMSGNFNFNPRGITILHSDRFFLFGEGDEELN